MRIFFQNPTQGPLITVSFDNDGPLLAFVPAVLSSAPADVAASGAAGAATMGGASLAAPLALAVMMSGDSSPQPLQGITRFAPRANVDAAVAGVPNPLSAVDLPESPSATAVMAVPAAVPIPAGDNRMFLDDLKKDAQKSPILTPTQCTELLTLIDRALRGEASVHDVAKMAWKLMTAEMLAKIRAAGIAILPVNTPDGTIYEIFYDFNFKKHNELLGDLLSAMRAITAGAPDLPALFLRDGKSATLRLPSWEYLWNVYGDRLKNVQFMARNLSPDDIYDLHARGLVPVQLTLTDKTTYEHSEFYIHGLIFSLHDIFHAIHWNRLPADIKSLLFDFYPFMKAQLSSLSLDFERKHYTRLLSVVVDADTKNIFIAAVINNAMVALAAVAELLDSPWRLHNKDRHVEILLALRERLLSYDQRAFPDNYLEGIHEMADRVEKRCTAQPCPPMIFE